MQWVKQIFEGKEGKKKPKIFEEKKEDKAILNKTFSPIPRPKKNQGDMQFEELRMLIKMAF